MILVTHGIVGGAIAYMMPSHPALAAVFSFVSHFAIDAIPHWDYPLRSISMKPGHRNSMQLSGDRLSDLSFIGLDGLAGLLFPLLFFSTLQTAAIVLICAALGMLPDPLQFLHSCWPHQPLSTLQRFHRWMHTDWQLRGIVGIVLQAAFCIVVITIAWR